MDCPYCGKKKLTSNLMPDGRKHYYCDNCDRGFVRSKPDQQGEV
jgi:transposase-like protein